MLGYSSSPHYSRYRGIVKIKIISSFTLVILSSFTHPQVFPNLYEFSSSVEHKRRYLKYVSNQTVDSSHWFHSIFFHTHGSQWLPSTVTFFQSIFFCFQQKNKTKKKLILVSTTWGWLNDERMTRVKMMKQITFWVNYPFKGVLCLLCSFTKSWFCFGGVLEHALMLGGLSHYFTHNLHYYNTFSPAWHKRHD